MRGFHPKLDKRGGPGDRVPALAPLFPRRMRRTSRSVSPPSSVHRDADAILPCLPPPPLDSQAEKEALISAARAEVATQVAATKSKMDKDIAEASAKAKADVDKQIAAAIAKLDAAKAESAKQVEAKATELSDQIIKKVVEV